LSEQNADLRKVVEQQKALILKLKTKKKMHKAEMKYRDRKDYAFLVMFFLCILYALFAMCVRGFV
jgi:hypothetical protein